MLLLCLAGCGPPVVRDAGDAARIICEGECRRDARCGAAADEKVSCRARCTTLPVRTPPVWRAAWARELAACFDRAGCGRDQDEACGLATSFNGKAAATCRTIPARGGYKQTMLCAILDGLTPDADARTEACLRGGRDLDACVPPFDWK